MTITASFLKRDGSFDCKTVEEALLKKKTR